MPDFMGKLKLNTQTIVILAGIVLIGASFAYYFMLYLPQKTAIEMKQKCMIAGEKVYTKNQQEYSGADFLFEPQYTYNRELNTCLYSGGYKKGEDWERWVVDSYTNEKLLSIIYFKSLIKDQDAMNKAIEKFWEQHKALFNNQDVKDNKD